VRALLQRTTRATVRVAGEVVGAIDGGLVILVGIGPQDTEATAAELARKSAELRIFRDDDGRMRRNASMSDLPTRFGALVSPWRPVGSVPRWRSSSSTTVHSRSGSTAPTGRG